jgi:hypothetical protein
MNAVQAVGLAATGEALTTDSGAAQLIERDHAVLARRDPGNERVRGGVGGFLTHVRE